MTDSVRVKTAIAIGVAVSLFASVGAPAFAHGEDNAHDWKRVSFHPYKANSEAINYDVTRASTVRVIHTRTGTTCDYRVADDLKLVAKDASVRSCISGKVIAIRPI
jgi:hypothetical protein